MRHYIVTMGIRIACFILMVAIQPYGWYTVVFGIGAVFLPYIAVVLANVSSSTRETTPETPDRALPASPTAPTEPEGDAPVIRISETPAQLAPRPDSPGDESGGPR